MKKIASFTINHDTLMPGVYVSRIDGDITTYDMRFVRPNTPPFLPNPVMHTIEHLFATYARNSEYAENVIYFGPMGCRTGFYLLIRDEKAEKVLDITRSVLEKIITHDGEIFGNTRKECGNFLELDLCKAKAEAKAYLDVLNSYEVDFKYKG